ncbi:MAG: DinB family protein [Bryobacterales bacterium]|nr:DinB family protein [Bryobacterales bacterium]
MIRLETVLNSWKSIREDTAQTVEDVAVESFDLRPLDDMMTFRELAQHILNAGHAMTGMLLDGVQDFSAPETHAKIGSYLPAPASDATLAEALRSVFDGRNEQLKKQPEEFFARMITSFDGQRLTVLEFIQVLKEHEITHRSQMFIVARKQGVVPVTTRRREQRQHK